MEIIDDVLYADILQCKKGKHKLLYEDEDGILLHSLHSNILYCGAMNIAGAKNIMKALPKSFEILVAHDTYIDAFIQEERGLTCSLRCFHSVYKKKEKPEVILPKGYEIIQLTKYHIEEIIPMYRHSMESLATKEYLEACIKDGMYGVVYGTELCGCIGVHEEESIGILEVKKEYQRKGLAKALEAYMIGKQMERNRIPYGEIKEENEVSLELSKKVGMEISETLTYWYFND